MFVLIFDPNPTIPFAFEPDPKFEFEDDAAAAAAANNKGFDVIVISRPELLLLLDEWFVEPIPFAVPDEPLFNAFDADEDTGWGRRGSRSNCWRAACKNNWFDLLTKVLFFQSRNFNLLNWQYYSPILVVVPIEFAFEVVAVEMVADCHDERHSTVTKALLLDQPTLGPMVTMQTNRLTNLNACLIDVVVDRPMHGLNVAYDEHLHDESQMAHRIYTVKEKQFYGYVEIHFEIENRILKSNNWK